MAIHSSGQTALSPPLASRSRPASLAALICLSIPEPRTSDGAGGEIASGVAGVSSCNARLVLHNPTRAFRNAIGAGHHALQIVVTARNADAIYYSIDIEYEGLWWPASEIRKHFRIGRPRVIQAE